MLIEKSMGKLPLVRCATRRGSPSTSTISYCLPDTVLILILNIVQHPFNPNLVTLEKALPQIAGSPWRTATLLRKSMRQASAEAKTYTLNITSNRASS